MPLVLSSLLLPRRPRRPSGRTVVAIALLLLSYRSFHLFHRSATTATGERSVLLLAEDDAVVGGDSDSAALLAWYNLPGSSLPSIRSSTTAGAVAAPKKKGTTVGIPSSAKEEENAAAAAAVEAAKPASSPVAVPTKTAQKKQSQSHYPATFYRKRSPTPKLQLKLPTPIFVLNLPKSGTLSIHKYFGCGLGEFWSSHHWMRNLSGDLMRLGECMGRNNNNNNDDGADTTGLIEGCGGFLIYTDAGAIWQAPEDEEDDLSSGSSNATTARKKASSTPKMECFYPGVHGLDNIAHHYPNATLLHLKRNTTEWLASARGWHNILGRMATHCDGFPRQAHTQDRHNAVTDDMWTDWYDGYAGRIQKFAAAHPSLTFVEGELESPDTPALLEHATGIPGTCFGHTHKTEDVLAQWEKQKAQQAQPQQQIDAKKQ